MFGPVEGKQHDSIMLADSGLLNQLQQHSFDTGGRPLCIYGDPAYPLRVHLQSGFRGANITREEELWNSKMSSVRQAVEWIFGDIVLLYCTMLGVAFMEQLPQIILNINHQLLKNILHINWGFIFLLSHSCFEFKLLHINIKC